MDGAKNKGQYINEDMEYILKNWHHFDQYGGFEEFKDLALEG